MANKSQEAIVEEAVAWSHLNGLVRNAAVVSLPQCSNDATERAQSISARQLNEALLKCSPTAGCWQWRWCERRVSSARPAGAVSNTLPPATI